MVYIYKIINLLNNKIYIGQHNGKNKNYFGGGTLLKKAIKKHGKNNFIKEIIVIGNYNQILLNELEKHYIRLYSSTIKSIGYNIQDGGKDNVYNNKFKDEKNNRKSECTDKLIISPSGLNLSKEEFNKLIIEVEKLINKNPKYEIEMKKELVKDEKNYKNYKNQSQTPYSPKF